LDVSSRSMYALIEPGSCFGGSLYELVVAADRSYMLSMPEGDGEAPTIALNVLNFGLLPAVNRLGRLEVRCSGKARTRAAIGATLGKPIGTAQALELGLITFAPDELDWQDEVRIAIEERVSLSPDALTGMEASLRFPGAESMETKIFGRLSAWQNWIFQRPNAVGEHGALKCYGRPERPAFDWRRT